MKKTLLAALTLSGVTLAGCVAVPVYEEPYVYAPPPAVVVQPSIGFSYYRGYNYGPRYYGPRHYYRYN